MDFKQILEEALIEQNDFGVGTFLKEEQLDETAQGMTLFAPMVMQALNMRPLPTPPFMQNRVSDPVWSKLCAGCKQLVIVEGELDDAKLFRIAAFDFIYRKGEDMPERFTEIALGNDATSDALKVSLAAHREVVTPQNSKLRQLAKRPYNITRYILQ